MPQFLLIDSDVSAQDAPVLYSLLTSPLFHVLGWVVTPSLYSRGQSYANGTFIKSIAKNPVPLHLGCPRGMMGPFPAFSKPMAYAPIQENPPEGELDGVPFLIDALLKARSPVTLLVLGPLTNLALALVASPRIREKISEVLVVGGAVMAQGDISPCAEERFWADPHAVSVLLSSQVPLIFFPLDLCQGQAPTAGWIDAWKNHLGQPWATAVLSGSKGPSFQGLTALAHLMKSPLLENFRAAFSTVETREGPLRGKLTVDWWEKLPEKPNVRYVADALGAAKPSKETLERLLVATLPHRQEVIR
ncbi:MAG: nucleoside hydrolase [Alphaproteobacteria bacterium]